MRWKRLGRSRECPAGIARYAIQGDTLYLWCAGSEGRREWIDNFRTRTLRMADGECINMRDIHQALAVLGELEKHTSFQDAGRVVLAGTSRGFAVAVALAYLMNDEAGTLPELIGWAGKRAGNQALYSKISDICRSITHIAYRYDVVPLLPPWYSQTRIDYKTGKSRLPWRAHEQAFRDAARWRNEAGTA